MIPPSIGVTPLADAAAIPVHRFDGADWALRVLHAAPDMASIVVGLIACIAVTAWIARPWRATHNLS